MHRSLPHAAVAIGFIMTMAPHCQAGEPLRLWGMFTSHAVVQRDAPLPIRGTAHSGEAVTISFAGHDVTVAADSTGCWNATLPPVAVSSQPLTLTVRGEGDARSLAIDDVLVGDVWLCSGQSNMGIHMAHSARFVPELKTTLEAADNPLVRVYKVPNRWQPRPATDVEAAWQQVTPASVGPFSTIGYLFADRIQREIGVPVGMIMAASGGTSIENWIPPELVEANPVNAAFLRRWHAKGDPDAYDGPGYLFSGSIAPVIPYALKGFLWYQGEANVSGFTTYAALLEELANSWRARWKLPDAPFLVSEIAPYAHNAKVATRPDDSSGARLRESMAAAQSRVPHLHVASIIDAGMVSNIHPPDKRIPAQRLSALARRHVYGQRHMAASGPVFSSWRAEGGTAKIEFHPEGGNLEAKHIVLDGNEFSGSTLSGFEVAGADRIFHPAKATIVGPHTLKIAAPEVAAPVAVRYAWSDFPLANLFNQAGFPATSFRTDDWPWKRTNP